MEIAKFDAYGNYSRFSTPEGLEETFLVLQSRPGLDYKESLDDLDERFVLAQKKLMLPVRGLAWTRIYLSDIANQRDRLLASKTFLRCTTGAVSIIEQAPLDASHLRLICYFVDHGEAAPVKTLSHPLGDPWQSLVSLKGRHYDTLIAGNLVGKNSMDSHQQTTEIFNTYTAILQEHKQTLLDNAVRTWIFVRDIDNHYQGMVDSRREFFDRAGLTKDTRYLASTGIEGKSREVDTLVSMDALSVSNLKPEQIVRMEALKYLCPTHAYHVTFERGIRVKFGDRSHLYLSGTASIDHEGKIVHEYDPVKQTRRTLVNIKALFKPHGMDLNDLAYLIIYLRNPASYESVMKVIRDEVPSHLPIIAVKGTVCRPKWLIEMEGIAIKAEKNPYPPFL
ncbi:MAG: hypothetical protein J0L75_09810 [Spirochaetes bacterium]|nr:hypothetical protein [Spirochaetota bacterium]